MEKSQIIKILGINEDDLIMFESNGHDLKVLYWFNGMYHVLLTDDIRDVNEGSSVSTDDLLDAEEEYDKLDEEIE